jgi:hypothetical protein
MPFADVLFSTNFILFPSDARGRSRMARGSSREREPAAGERKFVSGVMWLIARCVLNRSAPFMRPPVVSPAV